MEVNDFAKVNRTARNAFFGSLVLIGVFFMYNQIVEPHIKYLFALHRYKSAINGFMAKSKVIEDAVKTSEKKIAELTVQFAQVRNTLYTQAEAEEFFSDLQAISVETDCPIYSLTFVADEPSAEVKQAEQAMGITAKKAALSVAGTYENIMRLVERLQLRNRKVWIEGLNIEAISDEASQVKCDITVKIYTIQNKEAAFYE